ncbi:hypothetical protein DPX16_4829 [Anabarilius grahami]|uniref:Uncharacterized protein n=1 Tax=Anabarilius grahami TaxID=495550 RepID=A0A3N0ZAF6_ANAGA|nr:hypothetical protein DPX16_4829 [Anabarilius grahami]
MGLFLVPVSPVPPKPTSASDRLCGFRQDSRSLERYVEEFVELAYLANWPDACLNACFLAGLDEDTNRFKEPACNFSLVEAINLILFLNCSDFVIEEVLDQSCNPRPVPTETQAAWPVRQSPLSSSYPSSGHSPGVLPDPKTPMADEKSSAGPRWSKRKKKATKQSQSPDFSASVQPQSPEFSAAEQPVGGEHVGVTHVGGAPDPPWPPSAPDTPWPPTAPDPSRPPMATFSTLLVRSDRALITAVMSRAYTSMRARHHCRCQSAIRPH